MIPTLQFNKPRLRELKGLAQSRTARRWLSQVLDAGGVPGADFKPPDPAHLPCH